MTTPDTPVSSGSVVAMVFAMKDFGLRNPLKGEHHVDRGRMSVVVVEAIKENLLPGTW